MTAFGITLTPAPVRGISRAPTPPPSASHADPRMAELYRSIVVAAYVALRKIDTDDAAMSQAERSERAAEFRRRELLATGGAA